MAYVRLQINHFFLNGHLLTVLTHCTIYDEEYDIFYISTMKEQQTTNTYWCHDCRQSFRSNLKPGQEVIECPKCNGDFCELKNNQSNLRYFQPFQKRPEKKESNRLVLQTRAFPITVHELHQILQEENHQRQGIELSNEQLQIYAKQLQKDSECSVCRQDLKKGEKHPIFQCRHAFHVDCLVDWLKIKNSCPTCRHKMISN